MSPFCIIFEPLLAVKLIAQFVKFLEINFPQNASNVAWFNYYWISIKGIFICAWCWCINFVMMMMQEEEDSMWERGRELVIYATKFRVQCPPLSLNKKIFVFLLRHELSMSAGIFFLKCKLAVTEKVFFFFWMIERIIYK